MTHAMAELPSGAVPAQTHIQSIDERAARGRALRALQPREQQAIWKAPANRRDPIEILIEQGESRLPNLLPLRYTRMKVSPFAFFRGGAAVMTEDLAGTPATGLQVQACGDCHLLNFGGFATPERRLVFDINDFDETAVAPWEWDLKRLAASFVLATFDILDKDARIDLAQSVVRSYRETMARIADTPVLEAWYGGLLLDSEAKAQDIGIGAASLRKAVGFLTHPAIVPLGHGDGPQPRIKDSPPLVFHAPEPDAPAFRAAAEAMYADYLNSLYLAPRVLLARFRLVDVAYKVVGIGSVGTMCGVMLLVSGSGEALYLQFKEATCSVLEAHAGSSPFRHHGERVVRGQRLLQAASDFLLGYGDGPTGRHIYVRQLRDAKVKPQLETMTPKHFRRYAEACGEVLARAHARTADAVVLSAYLGKSTILDEAIGAFAHAYAKQTESDHGALQQAIKAGRLPDAAQDS
jgi:uncharacterized protein (DUF2252 family)